jgi:hypothetical protein
MSCFSTQKFPAGWMFQIRRKSDFFKPLANYGAIKMQKNKAISTTFIIIILYYHCPCKKKQT